MENKTIKIECYQNMVNYRKPTSIQFQESYKFPPYSTVIGMIHKVCDFTEYKPMKVSIQGEYKSSISNMQIKYFFTPNKYEVDDRGYFADIIDKDTNSKTGLIRSPSYAELIIDVDLIIHIQPEDESLFSVIEEGLKNPSVYPALGRHEDILRIDEVSVVELEETKEVILNYDAYIPIDYINNIRNTDITGTNYKLNKEFDTQGAFRKWKSKIDVKILKKGTLLHFKNPVFIDDKQNGVFYA